VTLRDRTHGGKSRSKEAESRRRLSPQEENIIERHILQLEVWGWPPLVSQVQKMAKKLLIAKGDTKDLGPNWSQRFLKRHPHLKSRFIAPLDKDRIISEDLGQIRRFFELF
jgi:hypothetical protein